MLFVVVALLVLVAGCVQEMADQPRYEPLEPLSGLPEGAQQLGPIAGTVARGKLELDGPFFSGKREGQPLAELPPEALKQTSMEQLLMRGQERFVVFCSHCHGQLGGGVGGDEALRELVGMVVERGFPTPPTFHQLRLRDAPVGHFFDVITNGFGRMPAHGYLIPPSDRWAIAAYIRALQLSQYAPRDRLSQADLKQLDQNAESN